jgi:subtilisin family serine protease
MKLRIVYISSLCCIAEYQYAKLQGGAMLITKKLLLVTFVPILVLGFFLSNGHAADGSRSPTQENLDRSIRLSKRHANLRAKAKKEGSIPVIVMLNTEFAPEGELSDEGIRQQKGKIERAKGVLLQRLTKHKVDSVKGFDLVAGLAMEVGAAALEELLVSTDVIDVQEDMRLFPLLQQSVPIVGGNTVWQSGYSGAGQAIAVLDTGVDKNHSFLTAKVVSEACFGSIVTSVTPDGLIDYTVRPFCPGEQTMVIAPGAGINCPTSINGCEHGTHVAGIAAGKGSNFSGVAKDANIIAIKVFSKVTGAAGCNPYPSPCITAYFSDVIRGLDHVFSLRQSFKIAAVNLSLGTKYGYSSPAVCQQENLAILAAIGNLRSVGIPTIAGAGNEGYTAGMASPACISNVISVGSTTKFDTISNFSNNAFWLSLLAPGGESGTAIKDYKGRIIILPSPTVNDIFSSVPTGFGFIGGTSQAAPHVSGAWAVIKSKAPSATIDQVLLALQSTGFGVADTRPPGPCPPCDPLRPGGFGTLKPRIRVDLAARRFIDPWMPAIISSLLN